MLMHLGRAVCAAAIFFGATSLAAAQQPITLRLATFGPPTSYFYVDTILPWAEAVSKDSQGTIEIKHFGGGVLANAGNMLDSVMTGAADIGWGVQSANPAKFVKSSIVGLPFAYATGEEGATALWRLHDKGMIASDYSDLKVLGFTAFVGGDIMTKAKKIEKLEDMKGLKIRVAGKLQSDTVAMLGATPVQVPIDELYSALDKGVVDGTAGSFAGVRAFKLHEVGRYFLDVTLNGAAGMLIMSQAAFDKLPAPAKAALNKHSGEALSRALGKSNDAELDRGKAVVIDAAKAGKLFGIYSLPASEQARFAKAVEPAEQDWVKATPDGARVLSAMRTEVQAIRAGK